MGAKTALMVGCVTVASWVEDRRSLATWSGNAGFSWPFDAAQLIDFYAAGPDRRILMATAKDGKPAGHLTFRRQPHRAARLGMVLLSPDRRGQGLGSAMLVAAITTAFEEMDVHRIELGVYTHNHTAIAVYEKLGFHREGVQREVTLVDGEWWSSLMMSVLEHEWPGAAPDR